MMSRQYRAMIYAAHSTIHMYSKGLVIKPGMTPGVFVEANPGLWERVHKEILNIFGYELSDNQLGTAFGSYLSCHLNPCDLNAPVYKLRPEEELKMKLDEVTSGVWTNEDIDAAYIAGLINSGNHVVEAEDPFSVITILRKELERLEKVGKKPHEAIRDLRYPVGVNRREAWLRANGWHKDLDGSFGGWTNLDVPEFVNFGATFEAAWECQRKRDLLSKK